MITKNNNKATNGNYDAKSNVNGTSNNNTNGCGGIKITISSPPKNEAEPNKKRKICSLIVASNRLPFVIATDEHGNLIRKNSAGGLVTAVAPTVIKSSGYWIGWAGNELTEGMQIPESSDTNSISHGLKSSQFVPIYYSEETFKLYYNGMCNASLWPLMHSLPSTATFRVDYWNAYQDVNKCFAHEAVDVLKRTSSSPDVPLLWIHDYHLFIMPLMVKNLLDESNVTCKIAFFLHIPFPSWDIFRLLPWANELLVGMLGSDLIAFHTHTYAMNFLDCCAKILGARIDKREFLIEYGNKSIVVRALPLGIPYDWFAQMAKESPRILCTKERVILGVDRLDYTKGILERLRGYERFLQKYPEYIEKVSFIQVAVPSRTDVDTYKTLKDDLEREIGRVCGKFATSDWTPVKYICKNISQYELAGYYRDARVALITAIRDGMNLVAKEYVACQTEDPGVLILSPFTGAGETMSEALCVNPLEEDMLADALKKALDMSLYERKLRMNALQNREKMFNLDTWLDSFFDACDLLDTTSGQSMQSLTFDDFDNWLNSNIKGYRLAILLDYDGTLVPLASHPDLAVLPSETAALLEQIATFDDVDVCITSGRSLDNLKQMVNVKNIHLAGSHGLELHIAGMDREECYEQASVFKATIPKMAEELRLNVCQHGGWIEEKVYHLTFHWRDTADSYRQIMIQKAKDIIHNYGFQVQNAVCAVEAKPPIGWDKGRGVYYLLEKLHGIAWASNVRAIFMGDDETDEDAIRALAGLGITFRIGKPNVRTYAAHRLSNPSAVRVFLEWAVKYLTDKKNANNKRLFRRQNQSIVRKSFSN